MRPHAQFLILTCHPERYKVLKSTNLIDAGMVASAIQPRACQWPRAKNSCYFFGL
ncbi:MAG: hypothetical protein ACLQOO_29690 [Terriglobia bacterium]